MDKKAIIKLTDNAINQIKKLLSEDGKADVVGLRIGVHAGGCSGVQYYMEYATEARDGEDVIEDNGVKIILDKKASLYLVGSEMDFLRDETGEGFVFRNHNAKSCCGGGCGGGGSCS